MIICGTGHRPNKLGGYGEEAANVLRNVAKNYLGIARPDRVISGMALGWDQALAWTAVDYKIPFTAAIPFDGQENAWPRKSQDEFVHLVSLADKVVYVSEGGYGAWKMQVRNEWMVDNADTALALWDGSPGGTGNCVGYAKEVNKPIVNLWDTYQEILHDR